MAKDRHPKPRAVREPVQVYLAADDSALLSRLVTESGLSKAEILRRGMRSFAREAGTSSPMLAFMDELTGGEWPASGTAKDHDAILTDAYLGRPPKRR